MKKLFTSVVILASFAGNLFAQTPFWTETFGGGIPSGWTQTGTPAPSMWKVTLNGPGGFAKTDPIVNSPTNTNGVLIFDSDSLDSNGGTSQGSGSAKSPQTGAILSSSINCSGHSSVFIQFYQRFFNFSATTSVLVSNGTKTDTIDINQKVFLGKRSLNPDTIRLNISSIAANQANVKIGFLFDGDYYYWMIDDVSLFDGPNMDLKITRAGSYDYTVYPLSQLDSISFYSRTINDGKVTAPNAKFIANVTKAGATVFTTSSTPLALPVGVDSALLGLSSYLPASGLGVYKVNVNVSSDSSEIFQTNNTDTSSFIVSDSIYAIDNGVAAGFFALHSDATPGNPAQDGEWVNLLEVKNADTLTSIVTSIAGGTGLSVAGTTIQGTVYLLNPNDLSVTNTVCSSFNRTLALSDMGTFSTTKSLYLPINPKSGNQILQPGLYAISVKATSVSGDVLIHNCQTKPFGQLSGVFDVNSGNGTPFSFYRNTNMFIRMSFGHGANLLTCDFTRTPNLPSVKAEQDIKFSGTSNNSPAYYLWNFGNGSDDTLSGQNVYHKFPNIGKDTSYNVCLTVVSGGQSTQTCKIVSIKGVVGVGINDVAEITNINFVPNPTSGILNIKAEGLKGDFTVRVYNIVGSEVKSYNEIGTGYFNKVYNMSDLANGSYFVKITNGDKVATKQLVITK